MKWFHTKFDGSESGKLFLMPKDIVLHFRISPFAGDKPEILDYWQMKGTSVLQITNKDDELPPGFELHPTEVCNELAQKMVAKMKSGWKPKEIIHYPSVWRVRAGDRVAIIGERPHLEDAMFCGLFEFSESALVYWLWLGGQLPTIEEITCAVPQEGDKQCEEWMMRAYSKVRSMGVPNTFAEDWSLG